MSKNISIKVGGVSRNFSNVPKIQTEEAITGNNIDWIPEDEANDYAVTETLRVTENGSYYPSSGKAGFSEVNVRVSGGGGTLIEKTITENGDYYAIDDNADGYSKVTVNVPQTETNISFIDQYIMTASGWVDNVYSLPYEYPANEWFIEWYPATTITANEYNALASAGLVPNEQSGGSVKALGVVPTINIPILLKVSHIA